MIHERKERLESKIYYLGYGFIKSPAKLTVYVEGRPLLHLNCTNTKCFINTFSPMVLPNLNKIIIRDAYKKSKYITDIFVKWFPQNVKVAEIFSSCKGTKIPNFFSEYFKLSSKVQQEIKFCDFAINEKQLKRIMVSFRHLEDLMLIHCKISVPKIPNFSLALKNTKLKSLSLDECASANRCNWNKNPEEFYNFIRGLGTSTDLRGSLDFLSLEYFRIGKSKTRTFLDENGLCNVHFVVSKWKKGWCS
ncbi:unnamed protein product [Moneuplotes crassus]|uniref:Uncharacterized protein n=1 Tax=Euplotes crassus TaxID=5936 RepID=A0AAD2D1H3_EUPCR|nr:unnamed protein product [Moneuplotes crassus]